MQDTEPSKTEESHKGESNWTERNTERANSESSHKIPQGIRFGRFEQKHEKKITIKKFKQKMGEN